MDKRILVATDSSVFSSGAEREAIKHAKTCGSQLYGMLVIEFNAEFFALAPQLLEKIEEDAKAHMEGLKNRAAKENVACETIVREGEEPYKLIIEEADNKKADLIVMGRRGKTGLMRVLMGNVTARVIGSSKRDVLVVPRAAVINWKNIVVATDGSKYSEAAARKALALSKGCCEMGAVFAVAVLRKSATEDRVKISEDSLNEIKAHAEKYNIKVETSLIKEQPHESIHETIIEYAKGKNADIIVMGSRGRTALQRLLMGSVTERVIGYSDCAVLVVKE
jgi:nucleotide-binding universal stress UspA family protein